MGRHAAITYLAGQHPRINDGLRRPIGADGVHRMSRIAEKRDAANNSTAEAGRGLPWDDSKQT